LARKIDHISTTSRRASGNGDPTMNLNNLIRLALRGTTFSDRGGHYDLGLPTGAHVGVGRSPHPYKLDEFTPETRDLADALRRKFEELDKSDAEARDSFDALAELAAAIANATRDGRLTPAGVAALLGPARMAALLAIAASGAALDNIAAELAAAESDLYAAPPIASGDMQAALDAREVREWFNALTQEQRLALLDRIMKADPTTDALLLALRRSPVPLPIPADEIVEHAWCTLIAKREPDRAAALTVAKENHEWARHVVNAVGHYIRPMLAMGPREIVAALGEHRAQARLFEVSDSEAATVPAQSSSEGAAKAA